MDERQISVLFNFKVVNSMSEAAGIVKPTDPVSEVDDFPSIPWADIRNCICNCSSFPNTGNVIVNENQPNCYQPDTSDCESEVDNRDNNSMHVNAEMDIEKQPSIIIDEEDTTTSDHKTCFSEKYKLKGSSFHPSFQKAIKLCNKLRARKETFSLRLHSEQVNLRDENALVVQCCIDREWKTLGYIPGKKVCKVSAAFNKNLITSISIDTVPIVCYHYYCQER